MDNNNTQNTYSDDLKRKNNKSSVPMVIITFLLLFIVTGAVLWFVFAGDSDYEKGMSYLKDRQYTEALIEFQKVNPSDKDFNNAQSKIHYINGLRSYNEGNNPEALVFLSKVNTNDEYYHDAQLMLEKINDVNSGGNLQAQIDSLKKNKDTVIIQKQTVIKNGKAEEPVNPQIQADIEQSRDYISRLSSSITRFEGVYQSARTAPLNTKSDYSKSMESLDKESNNLKYSAGNKDEGVLELKRLTSQWMDKRISFVRQLISERSVSETNLSRPMKEEGDRLYSSLISQLNKVKKRI
jgi:tetratricopeptide (TPR) repeat protein